MIKKIKFKYFIFTILVTLLGIANANCAQNPYVERTQWGINCTWYAWEMAYEKAHVTLPGWGNANTWINYAKKAGYETGTTPKANSIIVKEWSSYGHVAYVEKVDEENIYVWDSNGSCFDWDDPVFKKCMDEAEDQNAQGVCYSTKSKVIACEQKKPTENLIGYIYLDNAPKTPVTGTNNNTTTTVTKSNNANLSNLTISDIELEFNKNTLKYEIEVKGKIEKVTVNAKPEHNKAKIKGTGDYELKTGENSINVEVTAENGTKKTYTITIKKLDSNAFLESLSISNIDFEFNKEVLEYNLDVESEVNSINIKATLESDSSKVEGLGTYNLNIGENTFAIKVTAEDGTENTYKIAINRKNQNQVEEKQPQQTKTNKNNKNLIIYILSGTLIVTIIITITLIFRKKHKKETE